MSSPIKSCTLDPVVTFLAREHVDLLLPYINIQNVPVLSTSVTVVDSTRDLGVVIDSGLTMSDHVTAACRSAYYQLRQLRMIAHSLSDDAKKTPIQSFVSCRLDYCNTLLYGISGGQIQRLQSVQNAAARLVTEARRRDHITPVLRKLHWLLVKQRIDFKLAVLVYKSLHSLAPPFLSDDWGGTSAAQIIERPYM